MLHRGPEESSYGPAGDPIGLEGLMLSFIYSIYDFANEYVWLSQLKDGYPN